MTTTVRIKASEIYKDWHVIDAAGRPLGRVASEAAVLLKGKHKPTYEPHLDDGDFVIIVNANQVKVTGRKSEQIKYHTHSGYPGGLRTRSYAEQFARFPERVIEQAVWGMLPGGSLGEAIFRHLKVYKGPNHPHQSQLAATAKAQADRATAQAAIATATLKKPARLRPLSVPTAVAESPVELAPVAKPKAPAKVKAPAKAKATPVVEVVPEAKAKAPARRPKAAEPVAAAAAPKAAEAPKPRAPRKAAEEAPVASTEEKKPARRRTAKTEE
jgi:large subunit ribosomal protein L13